MRWTPFFLLLLVAGCQKQPVKAPSETARQVIPAVEPVEAKSEDPDAPKLPTDSAGKAFTQSRSSAVQVSAALEAIGEAVDGRKKIVSNSLEAKELLSVIDETLVEASGLLSDYEDDEQTEADFKKGVLPKWKELRLKRIHDINDALHALNDCQETLDDLRTVLGSSALVTPIADSVEEAIDACTGALEALGVKPEVQTDDEPVKAGK